MADQRWDPSVYLSLQCSSHNQCSLHLTLHDAPPPPLLTPSVLVGVLASLPMVTIAPPLCGDHDGSGISCRIVGQLRYSTCDISSICDVLIYLSKTMNHYVCFSIEGGGGVLVGLL